MCYHNHAQHYIQKRHAPRMSMRLRQLLLRLAALAGFGFAATLTLFATLMVINAMHATAAQLDAAHLQGLQVGMSMCPSRGGR